MTSVLAAIAFILPALFLYSPKTEKNRVVTIAKTMVITQERRTPAYYLYQQIQAAEKKTAPPPVLTTYLSTQNYSPPSQALAVSEMKVDRREIASEVDAGFRTGLQLASEPGGENKIEAERLAKTASVIQPGVGVDLAQFSQQAPQTKLAPSVKWATVQGKFETRGVGIGIENQVIELTRIEEGQVRERGRIDLKAGMYAIEIESPKGYLVAEIKDQHGVVIGRDRQRITNLASRGQYFEGPFIQVRHPESVGVNPDIPSSGAGTVAALGRGVAKTSATDKASGFKATIFSNQNALENAGDDYANISRGSSTISFLTDDKGLHRQILTVRQPGDLSKTPVFTEKWIEGMLAYISDQRKIEFKSKQISVLIGRAMVDQKPAAGIQVQIENLPGVLPLYLDQFMIPSAQQSETSENGYFMFLGLEDAAYTVSAFRQNQIIGHQLFFAQEGSVSYQNILSTTIPTGIVLRSFDAFTGEPIETDVTTPDLEEVVQTIGGTANYRRYNDMGVTQFYVRTNNPEYVPLRYLQDARKEYAHFPQIQERWIRQIMTDRLINEQPETGLFIGFVPEFEYQVYLIHEGYNRDNIVYFDMQGRITPVPVKGGGFILFNVPIAAREVVVQQDDSEKIYSQVLDIKSSQVSVSHFAD